MNLMYQNWKRVASITVVLLIGAARCIAEDTATIVRPTAEPPISATEGYLLIEEDTWYQLADEPDIHFLQGRRDYLRNEPIDAASSIRKGTAILMLAAAHSRGEPKKKLQASILELETLAIKLDHDEVHSARSLDRIFSRAFFALANYNEEEARRHLKLEETEKAQKHLRAASRNVVHAAAWRGVELEDHLLHTLDDLNRAASRLLSDGSKGFVSAIKSLDELHAHFEMMQELLKSSE